MNRWARKVFDWLFGKRRRLFEQTPSEKESQLLNQGLWQARFLSAKHRDHLLRWSRVFIAEKNWEGCNGMQITETVQWSVAASAGLLVLAYPDWYYDKTQTILVYPTPYVAEVTDRGSLLTMNSTYLGGEYVRAGETIYRGPVILNWEGMSAGSSSSNGGQHLGFHEFAHQLDMINGPIADGLPPLPAGVGEEDWRTAFHREFEHAKQVVASGRQIWIDHYGLTSESEFFAVSTEAFFQEPHAFAQYHPNVYELLLLFYQIDMQSIV
ncbi:MAG: M90 family metallopeptidase [Pirellula sp.]|nr:M90 family metallopeptidase [Pirellula sp.]